MIEEQLDPRPQPDLFARVLALRAMASGDRTDLADWLRGWNDREADWTNLHNIGHWIDRTRD